MLAQGQLRLGRWRWRGDAGPNPAPIDALDAVVGRGIHGDAGLVTMTGPLHFEENVAASNGVGVYVYPTSPASSICPASPANRDLDSALRNGAPDAGAFEFWAGQ